jgi:hypothetical protein
MDGYQWLARDHRDISSRLEEYERDPQDARAHAVCDAIDRHIRIVEGAVAPILRGEIVEGQLLAEAAEVDHATLQTLIARVYVAPPDDLEDVRSEIARGFEQHVRAEEREMLVRLRAAGVDGEQLGTQLDKALARAG